MPSNASARRGPRDERYCTALTEHHIPLPSAGHGHRPDAASTVPTSACGQHRPVTVERSVGEPLVDAKRAAVIANASRGHGTLGPLPPSDTAVQHRAATRLTLPVLLSVRQQHGRNNGSHRMLSHDNRPRSRQARSRASLRSFAWSSALDHQYAIHSMDAEILCPRGIRTLVRIIGAPFRVHMLIDYGTFGVGSTSRAHYRA